MSREGISQNFSDDIIVDRYSSSLTVILNVMVLAHKVTALFKGNCINVQVYMK